MFSVILSYSLKPHVLESLYLLFLIPVIMAVVAVIVIKRSKASAQKRFDRDDEIAQNRQKEIEAEKALDDDFGDAWHIHGSND